MPARTTLLHGGSRGLAATFVAVLLASCSGGGGGDDGNTPAPTVQLAAQPTTVTAGGTSTLTWSSTNADTCVASGGWSGTKFISDSEDVGPLTSTTTFALECNGRGGSGSASVTVTVDAGAATVSGQLLVPTTSRSDSDVNDPFAPFAPNDNDLQAQVMPNPVLIGGYVNEPGAGPDGRSFAIGDEVDFYRMDLVEGQTIELVMPTATVDGDDADLFLFKVSQAPIDENDEPVASSLGTGQVEQIQVPAGPLGGSGEYFIVVAVFEGDLVQRSAPIYRLSVGQSGIQSTAPQLRLRDAFVPGEVIVTLKNAGDSSVTSTGVDAAVLATRYGMRRKGGDSARAMLLELPTDTSKTLSAMTPWSRRTPASMAAGPAGAAAPSKSVKPATPTWRRKLDTLLYAKRLRADPAVRFADLNRVMRPTLTPADPGYAIQRWHYEQIQLPGAWEITTGDPVSVAVVDTGVVDHPDLVSKLVDGFDFISSPSNEDGDGRDPDPTDPGCAIGGGSIFHGTHVSGTIGARSNDNPTVAGAGVAGVSWGARIMPIRALDGCAGTGSSFDIIQGIRYAAGLSNDSGTVPAQRAAVINLSFGAEGSCDSTVVALFEAVRQQGVAVVASAGNDNTSAAFTPASCPNVISVGAVGPLRTRAPYSNFGSTVDLAAPGGDMSRDVNGDGQPDGIFSTHASGGGALVVPTLDLLQGTSMAAPHVAGVIALMLSVSPSTTPLQIDTLIAQGSLTDDIGVPGRDDLGIGLINAHKAVLAVDPNAPPLPPTLSVTPSSLAFGNIGTVAQLVASNAGGGTLTVLSVVEAQPWLTVEASSVDANGLGEYTVTVNRTGLASGTYTATIRFTSNAGTFDVEVLMDVGTATGEPSAGEQYVLLTDPVTGDTLAQVEVLAEGTSVPYLFENVPPGEYILISGTDLNNDQFICDPGEACGAYPVESAPVPIVVGEDGVAGLDFLVNYRSGTPGTMSAKSGDAKKVRRLRRQPPSQ